MRHQKKKVTLDRGSAQRRALLANLAESVILYEKVKTTKAKAKAVKSLVDKLITDSKAKDLSARRKIEKKLYTQNAVRKLMEELSVKYADRKGGYTRIIKLGNRKGDGAEEAVIELV